MNFTNSSILEFLEKKELDLFTDPACMFEETNQPTKAAIYIE